MKSEGDTLVGTPLVTAPGSVALDGDGLRDRVALGEDAATAVATVAALLGALGRPSRVAKC